jgi:fumarate reductase flavoprotein subunit
MPLPIVKGPFYAIRLQRLEPLHLRRASRSTASCNVIGYDGKPIPNLYAAGEMLGIGQLMGKAVCGGMSVTPALALGRVLGGEILEFGA